MRVMLHPLNRDKLCSIAFFFWAASEIPCQARDDRDTLAYLDKQGYLWDKLSDKLDIVADIFYLWNTDFLNRMVLSLNLEK